MDTPICTLSNERGAKIDIYPRFGRISAPTGEIMLEYTAAHVARTLDEHKWPWPQNVKPRPLPQNAVVIDRYGDYRTGRNTPIVVGCAENAMAAMLAMRPVDVSHMQNDDNGCGAAVVAHLTGKTYAETINDLYPSGNVRILGTRRFARATNTICHMCKTQTWSEATNAVAVLIKNTDPRLGRHYGHYVSIDPGMVIVDPELVEHYALAQYPRKTWTPLAYFSRS